MTDSIFDRTLVISPHLDDETIGCGGTISRLRREGKEVYVLIATAPIVFTAPHLHTEVDTLERVDSFNNAMDILSVDEGHRLKLDKRYDEGHLDTYPIMEIITSLDRVITEVKPTAVLFPYSSHHQDHQILNQASIAALRPKVSSNFIKLKAMYEYPYITGWNSAVTQSSRIYISLDGQDFNTKKLALKAYASQLNRDPRDPINISSIMSLMEMRGHEVGTNLAESLYPITLTI